MADSSISRDASPNLDFLRATAVLLVLFNHVAEQFYPEKVGLVRLADIGHFGVLLFFVHTSLVLMYSLQRSQLAGWALARNFYTRRFFRIYPLSVLTVLVVVTLHLHDGPQGLSLGPRPSFGEVAANLALVQNLTGSRNILIPLWTLPIELQMYLVLPFLFLWRRRSVWSLFALLIASVAIWHFVQAIPTLRGPLGIVEFFPNFLAGILAFTLLEKRVVPIWIWPPFVLLITAVYVGFHSRRVGIVVCLLLGFAIPHFKEITFRPLRFLSHEIATYSYGLYLGHPVFIWLALVRHHSWILFWLMWLFVPPIFYYGVERPAIRLGLKLAAQEGRTRSPNTLPSTQGLQ